MTFHDPTQQSEGAASRWKDEPLAERHPALVCHTKRPFNAEPSNRALQEMITPKGQHYRRTHAPVPVVDAEAYRLSVGLEHAAPRGVGLAELRRAHAFKEVAVTLMCTGNRRGEFNAHGSTAGLPWKNGSISTARWGGAPLSSVLAPLRGVAEANGYRFVTFWGMEDYHVSIPLAKVFAPGGGDVLLAYSMNGAPLPRDHGFPLRVIVPGFVGARSVKWLAKVVVSRKEVEGMHQTGIAYKQFGPNVKKIAAVTKPMIATAPPIDHIPVTSAITQPEPGSAVRRGAPLTVKGYAYSGAGRAVFRVDVSLDGGATWAQAALTRAAKEQGVRSGQAWAWCQWQLEATVPEGADALRTVCKAVDDQYNQQPHASAPIWNVRGILNTSWGSVDVRAVDGGAAARL